MAGLLVLGSIYHVLTRRGGGAMGAAVNKYSIKQVIWDRKRRRPGATKTHSSTTLGQTVAIVVLFAMTFCLCYIGVDYVDPRTCLFGGTCPAAASAAPPKTTFVGKRELFAAEPDESISHIQKLFPRDGGKDLNAGGYAPCMSQVERRTARFLTGAASADMDPLLSGPNTDVDKNYWTSSSRLGLISYAMYPLVVSLALKMWPFNIFATPWLTDWAYNKTGLFHRWFGRIIFILATLHVVLWTIQLFKDQDPYGRATFYPVWEYWRFKAGVVAYAAICAMVVLSLAPLRKRFYEITYYLHAALVIVLLVGSALHYK